MLRQKWYGLTIQNFWVQSCSLICYNQFILSARRYQMGKKRIIKLISFLIILFMVFQLIPSAVDSAVGYKDHSQSSKVFLSSGAYHTDVLLIGKDNQKTSVHKVQVNHIFNCIPQVQIEDFSAVQFAFRELPFDYRKVIRQSIQQYFNGSKYKNNLFVV